MTWAMPSFPRLLLCVLGLTGLLLRSGLSAAEIFRVATYNLNNYLEAAAGTRPAKTAESKSKIREGLRSLRADVVALQEMGSTNALLELRDSLKAEGLDYPYWEHVSGVDTNIHVAVLSRFPIVARRPHTNDAFLLFGRRFQVSRGFAEVDIRVNPRYEFTLFTAHLKSKVPSTEADEAELREQEAILLREKVTARLAIDPKANVIVLGDFNDTKDAKPIRALLGRGNTSLVDTRPAERNGDDQPNSNPRYAAPKITWTHYYGKEDSYGRFDYILLSHGMAKEWVSEETYVLRIPNWGLGSDHRPIVAGFVAEDK
jgi:endonuclease/exonuclease/phosphatase family metal-dependent hydrolase